MSDDGAVRTVAVLAAMPMELKPFVQELGLGREDIGGLAVRTGTVGNVRVVATVVGIGPEASGATTERLLAAVDVDRTIVIGIAGALTADVEIGHLVVPEVVLDGATQREHRPETPSGHTASGTLHTSGELVLDESGLAALRDRGVVALDMETAAIGEVCERHGCRWSVFRSISDRTTDGSVDNVVLGLTRPDGSPNLPAVAKLLATKPWLLKRLSRLAKDSKVAAEAASSAAIALLRTIG